MAIMSLNAMNEDGCNLFAEKPLAPYAMLTLKYEDYTSA